MINDLRANFAAISAIWGKKNTPNSRQTSYYKLSKSPPSAASQRSIASTSMDRRCLLLIRFSKFTLFASFIWKKERRAIKSAREQVISLVTVSWLAKTVVQEIRRATWFSWLLDHRSQTLAWIDDVTLCAVTQEWSPSSECINRTEFDGARWSPPNRVSDKEATFFTSG